MAPSNFLQTLEAQPWFANVAQIFANDHVPAPLWESTVLVEDPSLNPNAANSGTPQNPENSHGLFQINVYGGLATDPARVQAALGTPEQQAQWAAAQMAQAIAPVAKADLPTQLQAIEQWAWPGNLSENAQRQSALQDVLAAGGSSGSSSANPIGQVGAAVGKLGAAVGALGGGVKHAAAAPFGALDNTLQNIAINLGFGALGLGLLAAGGVILAGNSSVGKDVAKAASVA